MKCRTQLMLIMLTLFSLSYACKTPTVVSSVPQHEKHYMFPFEWIGHYSGQLTLHGLGKDTTQINMQLTIGSPGASGFYPWVLQYGEKDKRYYGVEVVNAEKGHYLIDEYNSIKLDAFLRGNHFISRFAVSGSDLIFHYEKKNEGIAIMVYSSKSDPFSETGGEIIAQDTVPAVESFRMNGYQSGFLNQVR